MKIKDIDDVEDAPPRERAALYLEMGVEMAGKKHEDLEPGKLPEPLLQKSVVGGIAGPVLAQMHGVEGIELEDTRGLKETGLELKTAAGAVPELTLNQRSRKEVVHQAMKKGRGDSVEDLMVRQLGVGMMDSAPIPRITAAYGYWQATGATEVVAPVLENATLSEDEEERQLAAYSLAHVDKRKIRHLQGPASDDSPGTSSQPEQDSMTVLIHGTFGKDSDWYQPGEDFHTYIKEKVYPDVYSGADFYFWSGRYSLNNTALKKIWKQAATKLVAWCENHPAKTLRLIAHSHGANVVNLATRMGLPACTLIQLSVPVRDWNLPKMDQVSSDTLFVLRSRIDLVVTIDGGAHHYRGTAVEDSAKQKIIASFGHSESHDPKKWKRKSVPGFVKTVCP